MGILDGDSEVRGPQPAEHHEAATGDVAPAASRDGSLTMARGWLILADDLTGAADCAIAFGRRGHAAVVTWGEVGDAPDRRLPVLAYDAASRGLAAEAAAGRHADVLERLSGPGRLLFKKIDSTLRGQPAAEMAAALAHLKSRSGSGIWCFRARLSGHRPHHRRRPRPGQRPRARRGRGLAARPHLSECRSRRRSRHRGHSRREGHARDGTRWRSQGDVLEVGRRGRRDRGL